MKITNSRLARLKELLALEERRVAAQAQIDSINQRMVTLRDAILHDGGSTLAESVSSAATSAGVSPGGKAKTGARRGRPVGSGKGGRHQRGALKEQILHALETAGQAGVRVVELAKTLGSKPVNIHSWFHSSIKRHPQIQKIKGGHYRLKGKLESGSATTASATPARRGPGRPAGSAKRGPGRPAKAKASTSATGQRGGRRRGALSEKILGELQSAGSKGISVRDIADKTGANFRNIYVWFATTGKKNERIKKVSPGHYRIS